MSIDDYRYPQPQAPGRWGRLIDRAAGSVVACAERRRVRRDRRELRRAIKKWARG